jgi:hypothetical protein
MSTTRTFGRSTTMLWAKNIVTTPIDLKRRTSEKKMETHQKANGRSSWSLSGAQHYVLEVTPRCPRSRTSLLPVPSRAQGHLFLPTHLFRPMRRLLNNRKRSTLPSLLLKNLSVLNANNLRTTIAREAADAAWSCKPLIHQIVDRTTIPRTHTPYRTCLTTPYDVTNFFFELFTFSHCVTPYHTKPVCHLVSDANFIPFVLLFQRFVPPHPNKR